MRRALVLVLLMLAAGCGGSTPGPAIGADGRLLVPASPGRPLAVLVAGDSLASGYHASDRSLAFPALVSAGLTAARGGPVQESRPPLRDQPLTTVDRVLSMPPGQDVVLVELGTNDIGRRTPADVFRARYGALLAQARTGSPTAALVCVGVWGGDGGLSGGAAYDTIIASLCGESGGRFVGVGDLYNRPDTRGPAGRPTAVGPGDSFHPNDLGHRLVADAVLGALDARPTPQEGP